MPCVRTLLLDDIETFEESIRNHPQVDLMAHCLVIQQQMRSG